LNGETLQLGKIPPSTSTNVRFAIIALLNLDLQRDQGLPVLRTLNSTKDFDFRKYK